jgi:hypothetical protein
MGTHERGQQVNMTNTIKAGPVAAGTAYGALQSMDDFLDAIITALADRRDEHARRMAEAARAYLAEAIERVSEPIGPQS